MAYNGSCYFLNTNQKSWDQHIEGCIAMDAHLAAASSQEEALFLKEIMTEQSKFYTSSCHCGSGFVVRIHIQRVVDLNLRKVNSSDKKEILSNKKFLYVDQVVKWSISGNKKLI